jgi:hypothetical protein
MAITLYNRAQLKDKFKNGSFSTEDKFSALIDSLYNRSDDSVLQGPLGYVNTSGLIGPTGSTHHGLYVGYGNDGNIGKVIILPEGIQVYNDNINGWVTLGTRDTLAANTVYNSQDFFTLRYGSTQSLANNTYSGLKIENFDGLGNNGIISMDKNGNFLLGPENNPGIVIYKEGIIADNSLVYWSTETNRLIGSNIYTDPLTDFIGIGKTGPLYNLDVNGDVNFTGSFFQNGVPFKGSVWTTNTSCIYYLGNVSIGGTQSLQKLTVEGDFKLTGAFYDSLNSVGLDGEVLVSTVTGTHWKTLSEITGVTGIGMANYLAKWTGQNSIGDSSIKDELGVITIGPSSSTNLVINGTIQHNGFVTTEGFNIDQIKTITKSLILTSGWQDVGINSTDIETGTYLVQLYANDSWQGGSNNNEYYSGILSWYSGVVKNPMELPNDEIVLHRSGGGSDGGLYLRTYKYVPDGNPGYIKLQIYSNFSNIQSSNYVFKFRRMI